MRRRELIAGMSIAAIWPFPVLGQQSSPMRRVGVFYNVAESDPETQSQLTAFRRGLSVLGWIEGRNLHIEYRWMDGRADRATLIAKDLVNSNLGAILVIGGTAITALLKETKTIPVVFHGGADPVAGHRFELLASGREGDGLHFLGAHDRHKATGIAQRGRA